MTRPRINERLARAARFPVALVVAPAGFGKSIALRDFLESARIAAVRYDVRREDGTLLAFVRHLSEALEPVAPGAIAAFPSMQERVLAADEPVRRLSDWFVEHLKSVTATIAIDDLHYAAVEPASIALLADVIERTSERIRWFIAARSDAGLPVATWIAYGRMDIPLNEDDLRFTTGEALAAAAGVDPEIEPQEVETLRHLTEGWPVALTIALRTRVHSADLRSASAGTREMIYRYLAEQVLAALSPQELELAERTSVFSVFDGEIVRALGGDAGDLEVLRAKIAFLNEVAPGQYRYHDLFREFLETELRRGGTDKWAAAFERGAQIMEQRGEPAAALTLYARARNEAGALRVLHESGFTLYEQGESDALSAALEMLAPDTLKSDAAALGLHAMLEAGRGRFEKAAPDFLRAIDRSRDDRSLELALVHRYAVELVRSERDAVAILEPYAADESIPPAYRVSLLGTLATSYVRQGRTAQALTTIEQALPLAAAAVNDYAKARLYQQAAHIYDLAGMPEPAQRFAEDAVQLALSRNLFDLAARAYSVLYALAYDGTDDPRPLLAILEKLDECARKGASNQPRLYALIAAYQLQADRGDERALDELEEVIAASQGGLLRQRSTALLPARALRRAWEGDFAGAHDLLAQTTDEQRDTERRALRLAEIAVYAIAAGRSDAGETAVEAAANELDGSDSRSRRTVRSRILLGLAELLRGHTAASHRRLSEAERSLGPAMERLRRLAAAARALYRRELGQAGEADVHEAIARLREAQFGGMARLMSALPLHCAESAYVALTPAEREILQLLAGGASSKDVAGKTGRSPHTVDTHIRSICRKLNCNGRREAVALATRAGWVLP